MKEYKVKVVQSYVALETYLNDFCRSKEIVSITANTVGYTTNYTIIYKL